MGRTAHAVYGVTAPAPMAARANESGGHGPLRDGAAPAWRRDADDDDETAPRTRVALPGLAAPGATPARSLEKLIDPAT